MKHYKKSGGKTLSEQYLGRLCERSFLSLWSYPNLYSEKGKELCDLLVISGNDIIIFSDKNCGFPNTGKLMLDWSRWFRKTVSKSVSQLWGAERQIKKFPGNIFLDDLCTKPLQIPIDLSNKTKFHLVAVAHGASQKCVEEKGGIGTLMFHNEIRGIGNHKVPFTIGDLDCLQTFVHVLDDTGLDIVMDNLTTISDFTDYLSKRELFCRSSFKTYSPGEEDLLGFYLLNWDNEVIGKSEFKISERLSSDLVNQIPSNYWDGLQENPQWIRKLEADQVSFFWDDLINRVSHHAIDGTLLSASSSDPFFDCEKILRFLARESRFSRRMLSDGFIEAIKTTSEDKLRIRLVPPSDISKTPGLFYVFLLYPKKKKYDSDHDRYRLERSEYLYDICLIARLKFPEAKYVIGIGKTAGIDNFNKSEDLFYFDCSIWDEELENHATSRQKDYNVFVSHKYVSSTINKYPTL
jgi:hypothetical protein